MAIWAALAGPVAGHDAARTHVIPPDWLSICDVFEVAVHKAGDRSDRLCRSLSLSGAGHGNKKCRLPGFNHQLSIDFFHHVQHLLKPFAQRHNQPAALPQLRDERLRNLLGAARHEGLVERGVLGPSGIPIANLRMDIFISKCFKRRLGAPAQWLHDFDRVNVAHQRAEHGRMIAAASANFEHAVCGRGIEPLGH